MTQPVPIPVIHLFPVLDNKLIELLRSLSPDEWHRPTIAKKWTVKDIAAHLLDGNVRTLCLDRDKHQLIPDRSISNYRDLVDYLNELNATWVNAAKRMSPSFLVDLLERTGKEYAAYLATLDPFADAIFSVAWAGDTVSPNWFHIAREYTEKFIHQQQIRDAVGKPGIITRELFFPFIDTFMRALPHRYKDVTAAPGTTVCVTVTGDAGGEWYITRNDSQWEFTSPVNPQATFRIDPDTAWKLFSKGMTADQARDKVEVSGDASLAEPVFQMISVMA